VKILTADASIPSYLAVLDLSQQQHNLQHLTLLSTALIVFNATCTQVLFLHSTVVALPSTHNTALRYRISTR